MTRIAVGGFLHETNTFAPTKATYADFVHGGGWPAMAHGSDVLKTMRNINVGLAGFIEAAEARGWELVPTVSSTASPPPDRSTRFISTCTARWSRNISTTAKARFSPASAN
jgi:microcystin degradation protein MlrC